MLTLNGARIINVEFVYGKANYFRLAWLKLVLEISQNYWLLYGLTFITLSHFMFIIYVELSCGITWNYVEFSYRIQNPKLSIILIPPV